MLVARRFLFRRVCVSRLPAGPLPVNTTDRHSVSYLAGNSMDKSTQTKRLDGLFLLAGNSLERSTPTKNSGGGRLQPIILPAGHSDHFKQRAQFAHYIARRLADGANLENIAHQTNVTANQVVRMVAMFAVQAGEVGKVCLGTVCLTFSPSLIGP